MRTVLTKTKYLGLLLTGVTLAPPVHAVGAGKCGGRSACVERGGISVVITNPGGRGSQPSGAHRAVVKVRAVEVTGSNVAITPSGRNTVARAAVVTGGRSATSVTKTMITEVPCITADTVAKYSCVRTRMSGVEAGVDFAAPAVPAAAPQGETVTQVAVPTYTPEEAAAQAWTTQIFTKPGVDIQPVGNTTLTGLPTYFRAAFGAEGLAPGESVTTTVLGHTVTIRPASALYTYHYGDGTSHGPTPDAGGVYPSGAVTHTYARKGVVNTRIDVTLTGEFRIGGGAWQPIPGSTTVAGTPEQLTVAILQSRLHH